MRFLTLEETSVVLPPSLHASPAGMKLELVALAILERIVLQDWSHLGATVKILERWCTNMCCSCICTSNWL